MQVLKIIVPVVVLLVLSGTSTAMKIRCEACLWNCCQWAHAARGLALPEYKRHPDYTAQLEGFYRNSIKGINLIPCQDAPVDSEEYEKCAWRAYERCKKESCSDCFDSESGQTYTDSRVLVKPGGKGRENKYQPGSRPERALPIRARL